MNLQLIWLRFSLNNGYCSICVMYVLIVWTLDMYIFVCFCDVYKKILFLSFFWIVCSTKIKLPYIWLNIWTYAFTKSQKQSFKIHVWELGSNLGLLFVVKCYTVWLLGLAQRTCLQVIVQCITKKKLQM